MACAFSGHSFFFSVHKPLDQILGGRESFLRPGKEVQRKWNTGLVIGDIASGPSSATIKSRTLRSDVTLCGSFPSVSLEAWAKGLLRSLSTLRFSTFEFALQPLEEQPADLCAFGPEFG